MASKKEVLGRKQRWVLRMFGCKVYQHEYRRVKSWYWYPLDETLACYLPDPGHHAFGQRFMDICRQWGLSRGLELTVYVMSSKGIHVDVYLKEAGIGRVATADTVGEAMVEALYDLFRAAGMLKGRK